MRGTTTLINKNKLGLALLALASVAVLVVGLWTSTVSASSLVGVSSNIAQVPNGESLVLTVTTQDDGDVHYLEVDHSLQNYFPEFYVYADEAAPYGDADDLADFTAAGVTVTYSEADSQWTIDLGDAVTDSIVNDHGGDITFYFVLRDADDQILWGNMGDGAGTPVDPAGIFSFDLVEGTGDELIPTPAEESDDEPAVPGVPNTSVGRP